MRMRRINDPSLIGNNDPQLIDCNNSIFQSLLLLGDPFNVAENIFSSGCDKAANLT